MISMNQRDSIRCIHIQTREYLPQYPHQSMKQIYLHISVLVQIIRRNGRTVQSGYQRRGKIAGYRKICERFTNYYENLYSWYVEVTILALIILTYTVLSKQIMFVLCTLCKYGISVPKIAQNNKLAGFFIRCLKD